VHGLVVLILAVLGVCGLVPAIRFARREVLDARTAACTLRDPGRARRFLTLRNRRAEVGMSGVRSPEYRLDVDAQSGVRAAVEDEDFAGFSEYGGVKVPR